MKTAVRKGFAMHYAQRIAQLGTRMIMACVTALVAAVLIFSAPEVGIAGAIGGLVAGGISVALFKPHILP